MSTVSTLVGHTAEPDSADPHLWLEEVTGERPLDWVKARNSESTGELSGTPGFEPLREKLLEILDSNKKIPFVSKHGDHYYNFWRDAKNRRGLWRRTTLAEYRQAEPKWETVLDLDALGTAENENWVWKNVAFLRPHQQRCLISLSRGGADATVVREFDVSTKTFVKDGFQLPEAKTRIAWRDENSVFVATDFGPGSMTDSGYPRIVKEWRRGQPLKEAATVYEGQASDVSASGFRDQTPGYERDLIHRAVTFWTDEYFLRRGSELIKIEKPADAQLSTHRDLLLLELRSAWEVGGKTYPAGALIVTDFAEFMSGKRNFTMLFEPTERRSLHAVASTKNHLLINELDNVRNQVYVASRRDGKWERKPLPGTPEFSTVSISAIDDEESDDYFMTVAGYLTPATLRRGVVGEPTTELLKENPSFFATQDLRVEQFQALSKDGTSIPYFQVSRRDLPLDGTAPTLLYGYGGFEIAMLPGYQPTTGVAWLEKGGVYVVANIRGGGEFGPKWHQAALRENRHRAYDDFAAVAEDLIKRKVTSSRHLGIMGGSNGGLLMGNMLTRRPDLFHAIVCQVPLLDMQRYHKLLAGASWVAEFGNPDEPKDWEFLRNYSPYHNVKRDVKYPRILFTTSTRDDRVHPGHARKMVARMKEQGHDVLYYENIEGGHGGAADNKQAANMWALSYTFLWKMLR